MNKRTMLTLILILCLLLTGLAYIIFPRQPQKNDAAPGPLTCTFLKVGKADAIVIETDGHTMAINAGEEDDGQEIVDFLKKRNISQLDYLLITHFDKDHVGGADTLISQIPAARVLIPDYEGTSTEYTDFLAALDQVKDYPTWDVSKLAGMPMADLIRFCHTASLDISNYLGLNGQILAFFVLGNIIGGRIQDKGHPRAVLVVGGAIMAGGVLLSALACRIPSV